MATVTALRERHGSSRSSSTAARGARCPSLLRPRHGWHSGASWTGSAPGRWAVRSAGIARERRRFAPWRVATTRARRSTPAWSVQASVRPSGRDDRGRRACGARRRCALRGGARAAAGLAGCRGPARARRSRAERRRRRQARASVGDARARAMRARRIVASRGVSERTLRYLASRGFSEDSLDGLVAGNAGRDGELSRMSASMRISVGRLCQTPRRGVPQKRPTNPVK